jgi:hypothetical protein
MPGNGEEYDTGILCLQNGKKYDNIYKICLQTNDYGFEYTKRMCR